ncbi:MULTISPECIES: hypothetical protein [Rhodococcus erythropolis group]|uniref:hypothetical protein n=1 Tax=Rhodococcus erythropolis group TaxID=2840174 RepID=UPI0008780D62|nr:hypothetical protein [Rhodococcus erythropolis]MDF2467735.1 hypothetical protein [Rhodococcus erythropolis]OFV75268.1 hypothetical protein RERY_41160 [Rhodococcus erythropolis]
MRALLLLDVPENAAVVETALSSKNVQIDRFGPYIALTSDADHPAITIDRRATGCRHAVWYSCVAGLLNSRISKWDSNELVVVPR